jgi:hypothetical protein
LCGDYATLLNEECVSALRVSLGLRTRDFSVDHERVAGEDFVSEGGMDGSTVERAHDEDGVDEIHATLGLKPMSVQNLFQE